jgi:hypothetical protein
VTSCEATDVKPYRLAPFEPGALSANTKPPRVLP